MYVTRTIVDRERPVRCHQSIHNQSACDALRCALDIQRALEKRNDEAERAVKVFVAEESGELELFCSVPGHRELGMTVRLIIE